MGLLDYSQPPHSYLSLVPYAGTFCCVRACVSTATSRTALISRWDYSTSQPPHLYCTHTTRTLLSRRSLKLVLLLVVPYAGTFYCVHIVVVWKTLLSRLINNCGWRIGWVRTKNHHHYYCVPDHFRSFTLTAVVKSFDSLDRVTVSVPVPYSGTSV